ncbi:MAG TPA: L,D-transpeptidase family protein [Arachidicoccus sp.]|nr:L,D-transpeptidase family protein [Arachidicoccus sp.]
MTLRKLFIAGTVLIILAVACGSRKSRKVKIDQTITPQTSYNNLFLDSNAIRSFIAKDSIYKPFEEMFINFYRHRNFEFAWFDTSGLVEQAYNFINLLNADAKSMKASDSSLGDKRLARILDRFDDTMPKNITHAEIVKSELTMTGEFFRHAEEVFKGKGNIDATQLGWFIPRKKIDFSALLDSTLNGKGAPDEEKMLNPQYKELRTVLQKYIDLKNENHNWDSIPLERPKLVLKDSGGVISQIKERLYLLGDLEDKPDNDIYDQDTRAAVKSFQGRYGLVADGVVGANFMKALNIPLDTLIRDITINLERVRWIPSELPKEYVWVNIPEYKLHAYEDSKEVFNMRVIVGSAAHGTTIFSGNIKYIVFAPYWNVPMSIVKKEIMPGMQNNPDYIRNHNMQITGYDHNIPVVRQLPGPDNSLGRVKFLFPNSYNIYLHDTPNHDLFTSRNRGLSHGCVRLSEPEKMANWLLRNDTTHYPPSMVDSLMNKNIKEKWVSLDKTVPVYLVYFTTWVDTDGRLNIRKDIYGHDAKIAEKLFSY